MKPILLPDDIEQKLLAGQRLRATHDLIERRDHLSMTTIVDGIAVPLFDGLPASASGLL